MKTSTKLVLVLAVTAAAAVFLAHASAQSQPAAAPNTSGVAVCDITDIFNNCHKGMDQLDALKKKREAIRAEDDQRKKTIDAISAELGQLNEGSEVYEKRYAEMQRLTIDRKAWLQYQEAVTLREHQQFTKALYQDVLKVVSAIAKEQNLRLVMFKDRPTLESENASDLLQEIAARKVIYSDPSIDITEQILARLNAEYKAVKAK